jgi:hypothetical protein
MYVGDIEKAPADARDQIDGAQHLLDPVIERMIST